MKTFLLLMVVSFLPLSLIAEDRAQLPVDVASFDKLDPKAWGIDKGCIETRRIKSFKYLERGAARLEMLGGKEVVMRFTNSCSGLRHNGVIYKTRIGKLCARFDSVRIIDRGTICPIESIEPFVAPVESDEDEPSKEDE